MARHRTIRAAHLVLGLCCVALAALPRVATGQDSQNSLDDWAVAKGLRLEVAARGFKFPTSIAFIPKPGSAPTDPLYYVAELHGTIKVVLRNGTIETFAKDFTRFIPADSIPIEDGENGTAGMCLDPARGYLFVTYVYQDGQGTLRNGMKRFSTVPGRFATRPTGVVSFDSIFVADRSKDSHQIGPCVVLGDNVVVAVGDGMQTSISQRLDVTLGKLLRMTVDGAPAPGNAFSSKQYGGRADWVWARGVRNVFGLTEARGRIFAAENGLNVDRFYEVEGGFNYLWEGNDWAEGMNAAIVFSPAVSPVQMGFVPKEYAPMPSAKEHFVLALAGPPILKGPGTRGDKGIISIDYDFDKRRLREIPQHLVQYRGSGRGAIVGLAVGPDGLYFAPLFSTRDEGSVIFRLAEGDGGKHFIGEDGTARSLMTKYHCNGCHVVNGGGGMFGPNLDSPPLYPRLLARLDSAAYLARLARPDSLNREPYTSLAPVRAAIAALPPAERPHRWLVEWLLEPRFANPTSPMPTFGMTRVAAESIATYLLKEPEARKASAAKSWQDRLPQPRYRFVVIALIVGAVAGIGVGALVGRRSARA